MDPRNNEHPEANTASFRVLQICAATTACAAAILFFTTPVDAQGPRLRRLPPPVVISASPHGPNNSRPYDARNVLHDTWDEPGVTWFANWQRRDGEPGLTEAYEVMFQNPHEGDDADQPPEPPPGTIAPNNSGLAADQTLGEEPEDYNVQFLRQQSVLLNRGDWQMDTGVQYALSENDIPIAITNPGGDVVGVVEGTVKNRLLLTPVEFRYGVTDRTQAFINVPLGWSHSELSFAGFDEFENELGIGDVSAGLSFIICDGCRNKPDVIATLSFTAPTGNADFPLQANLTPNSVLGQGFWGTSAQLLFIHTYDPVVLFWGFGYNHRFEEDFLNPVSGFQQDVRPGETAFYQCGVGFGVNESITLSASFAGAYISELYVDDDRVEGSILEPLRMRFAVTVNTPAKLIEPFAEFGMTDDSVDARFGVTWTHTHRNNCQY